jgi:beta-galactosidase
MTHASRRTFLRTAALSAVPAAGAQAAEIALDQQTLEVPLDGVWQFRIEGKQEWSEVQVPHTWQTAQETADYLGAAWYRRTFHAPAAWKGRTVRVEFEAVYHTATVTLNGKRVGEHRAMG